MATQFAQQIAPVAVQAFKQQHFTTPLDQQIAPVFDELLQAELNVNPGVVNNPQALMTLKTLAIGQAVQQGKLNLGAPAPSLPFSETPSSPFGNFQQQTPQADPRAVQFAKLLGIDPKVTNKVHEVFERNGVYRSE